MSRRDAIKWKKSRGVIFRPAHSYSASVASDSSQGLRFSSPIESIPTEPQPLHDVGEQWFPNESVSHRRTQSSGNISLAESLFSSEAEHVPQYAYQHIYYDVILISFAVDIPRSSRK